MPGIDAGSGSAWDALRVDGTTRSRTAQAVLAERAVLVHLGALTDPFARRMLTPAMANVVRVARLLPRRVTARSVTLAGLTARVRWFDAQVLDALDAGITQVVIVGAGYDSRAWRFRRDGVRFVELDHPATQADKVRRAPRPGPFYVPADLTGNDAGDSLRAHGFDGTSTTLFVVEGVTMYLAEAVVRQQLAGLAASCPAGSRLAVDFYPPARAGTARDRRQRRLQDAARIGGDEAFVLAIDRPDAVALVESAGWRVDEVTGLRTAARALVPAGSGLPADAVNDHKTLVAASIP